MVAKRQRSYVEGCLYFCRKEPVMDLPQSYRFPHGRIPILRCCISETPFYSRWGYRFYPRKYIQSDPDLLRYSGIHTGSFGRTLRRTNRYRFWLKRCAPVWQIRWRHKERSGLKPVKKKEKRRNEEEKKKRQICEVKKKQIKYGFLTRADLPLRHRQSSTYNRFI